MHSVESRFVIGSSNTLSDGVYYDMCNFQPKILHAGAVKGLMSCQPHRVIITRVILVKKKKKRQIKFSQSAHTNKI